MELIFEKTKVLNKDLNKFINNLIKLQLQLNYKFFNCCNEQKLTEFVEFQKDEN